MAAPAQPIAPNPRLSNPSHSITRLQSAGVASLDTDCPGNGWVEDTAHKSVASRPDLYCNDGANVGLHRASCRNRQLEGHSAVACVEGKMGVSALGPALVLMCTFVMFPAFISSGSPRNGDGIICADRPRENKTSADTQTSVH
jgi:hypothetical protein